MSTPILTLVLFFLFSTALGAVLFPVKSFHQISTDGMATLQPRTDHLAQSSVERSKVVPDKLFLVGTDVAYDPDDPLRPGIASKIVVSPLEALGPEATELKVIHLTLCPIANRPTLNAEPYLSLSSPWAFQELNKKIKVRDLEEVLPESDWSSLLPREPIKGLVNAFKALEWPQVGPCDIEHNAIFPGQLFVVNTDHLFEKDDRNRPMGDTVVVTPCKKPKVAEESIEALYLTNRPVPGRPQIAAWTYLGLHRPWAFQRLTGLILVTHLKDRRYGPWHDLAPIGPIEEIADRLRDLDIPVLAASTGPRKADELVGYKRFLGRACRLRDTKGDPDLRPYIGKMLFFLSTTPSAFDNRCNVLTAALTQPPTKHSISVSVKQILGQAKCTTEEWTSSPHLKSHFERVIIPQDKLLPHWDHSLNLPTEVVETLKWSLLGPDFYKPLEPGQSCFMDTSKYPNLLGKILVLLPQKRSAKADLHYPSVLYQATPVMALSTTRDEGFSPADKYIAWIKPKNMNALYWAESQKKGKNKSEWWCRIFHLEKPDKRDLQSFVEGSELDFTIDSDRTPKIRSELELIESNSPMP